MRRGDGDWSQAVAFEVRVPDKVFTIRAGSDAQAVTRVLLAAAASGPARVDFEPGEYTLAPEAGESLVTMTKARDLIIDGHGARLVLAGTFLTLNDCQRVTIQHFTITPARPGHTLVRVVRKDPAGILDAENAKTGGILHYTSTNLIQWNFVSRLALEPDNGNVIDPAVHPLPDGTWRIWYRAISPARKAILGYADSLDLAKWENKGVAVDYEGYAEGPCVFFWRGRFWMLLDGMSDKYRPAAGGLAVLKSADATRWEFQQGGLVCDPTTRPRDGKPGHCSVVVQGERAFLLYRCFAPGARGATGQLAELLVADGKLSCVREFERMKLEAGKAPRFRGGGAPDF